MNKNFCRVDNDQNITEYASDFIKWSGSQIAYADKETYRAWAASQDPKFYELVSEKPEGEVGVEFVPVEKAEIKDDGKAYRLYDRVPIVAPVPVYVVEDLIYGFMVAGVLKQVKEIAGDYWDLLTMRETVSADNKYWKIAFPEISKKIVEQGILTQEQLDEILKQAML